MAFAYVEPQLGETINASNAYYSDGTQPREYTPIVCEGCGQLVAAHDDLEITDKQATLIRWS